MKISAKEFSMTLLFILILINSGNSLGQSNNTEALFYNVGVGAFVSGIGAVINKNPEEKIGRIFIKGLAQGALGGYLVYESKNLVSKISDHNNLEINYLANIVNSSGISIIENAALNRKFGEQWNLQFGFNRIEFHTKENFRIRYEILPVALLLTAYSALGNKFETELSLQSGVFIFSSDDINDEILGIAIGTSIILNENSKNNYSAIIHEIIHVYQYNDFNFINTYFFKGINKIKFESNFFSKIHNLFYYDIQGPFGRSLYELENLTSKNYYDNFFEREAFYYSN